MVQRVVLLAELYCIPKLSQGIQLKPRRNRVMYCIYFVTKHYKQNNWVMNHCENFTNPPDL